MRTIGLSEWVAFLNQQSAEDFQGDKVDQFLSTHHVNPDDFFPFIFFQEETYCRNLVFKNKVFELLVLTWLPGQGTPIQDYSPSRSWMIVPTGSLTLKHFRRVLDKKNKKTLLKSVGRVEVREAGGRAYKESPEELYSITNVTSKPAVSVHLYAAPLARCAIYDDQTQSLVSHTLEYCEAFGLDLL